MQARQLLIKKIYEIIEERRNHPQVVCDVMSIQDVMIFIYYMQTSVIVFICYMQTHV